MHRKIFFIFIALPLSTFSQIKELPITQGELNRALNSAFNKLVAGNPNPGEVSNYATIDPINASFNVKGTIPIKKRERKQGTDETDVDWIENRNQARISYLSFSVSGALIDKQYGLIFSDSKLNSGIFFTAQYNFRTKHSHVGFSEPQWQEIAEKRNALRSKYSNDLAVILDKTNDAAFQRKVYLLNLQQLSARDKLAKKNLQHNLTQKSVDSLGNALSTRPGLADTLRTLEKEVFDLVMEIRATQQTIDSIGRLSATVIGGQVSLLKKILKDKYKNDYDTLLSVIPFQKFTTTWYTIIGEYNRKSYNTFDITLPFESQIKEGNKADAYKLGFAINHLVQNRLKNRTFFVNGGVAWIYKSNLDQLTAISVDQRKQFSSSDTTRSITTKYSVYTDVVKCSGGLNVSGHAYYIFGKKPSGVHLFPSLDIQRGHRVLNCSLGYIIAFKNTVKDQPVVNTELYLRFNDITNDADIESKFYKRNEIGLSFTLPFNIF